MENALKFQLPSWHLRPTTHWGSGKLVELLNSSFLLESLQLAFHKVEAISKKPPLFFLTSFHMHFLIMCITHLRLIILQVKVIISLWRKKKLFSILILFYLHMHVRSHQRKKNHFIFVFLWKWRSWNEFLWKRWKWISFIYSCYQWKKMKLTSEARVVALKLNTRLWNVIIFLCVA